MVRDEGCDLQRMRDGVSKFEKVAADAVGVAMTAAMPVNPALWPLTVASGHTSKVGEHMNHSTIYTFYLANRPAHSHSKSRP